MSLNRHFGEGVRNRFKSHRAERKPKSHSTLQGFYVRFDFALRARNLVSHWSGRMPSCDWNDQPSWRRGCRFSSSDPSCVLSLHPFLPCSISRRWEQVVAITCQALMLLPHQTGFQCGERRSSMCFKSEASLFSWNQLLREGEGPRAKCFL